VQGLMAMLVDRMQGVVRGQLVPPIAELGLEQSLEKYCQHICNVTSLELSFDSHINEKLIDPHTALMAFRIAQDALDHATQHRQPNFVSVKLAQEGSNLIVQVEDLGEDNLHLIADVEKAEKQFLERMEERMEDCAGQLQISRGIDSTLVTLELPLEVPRSARAASI